MFFALLAQFFLLCHNADNFITVVTTFSFSFLFCSLFRSHNSMFHRARFSLATFFLFIFVMCPIVVHVVEFFPIWLVSNRYESFTLVATTKIVYATSYCALPLYLFMGTFPRENGKLYYSQFLLDFQYCYNERYRSCWFLRTIFKRLFYTCNTTFRHALNWINSVFFSLALQIEISFFFLSYTYIFSIKFFYIDSINFLFACQIIIIIISR